MLVVSGQKGFAAWSRASAKRGVLIALAMGLAWLAAVLILQSLGDHVRNERALAVMLLIVFCASSKFSFWGVVAPLTAFATLYSRIMRHICGLTNKQKYALEAFGHRRTTQSRETEE